MKNKKLIYLIVLTLIIQLAFPFGLLYTNSSNYNFALEHSIDYKFKLREAYLFDYDGDEKYSTEFAVDGVYSFYRKDKIAVTIGEDGFAEMALLEDKDKNTCWFACDYYRKISDATEDYVFEPGIDERIFRDKVYETGEDDERECVAYMTAKVYKGVFIPTAIYVGDEKLLTFIHEN